jgi:pimeloyl-ACP methyl ester carboxylesterase
MEKATLRQRALFVLRPVLLVTLALALGLPTLSGAGFMIALTAGVCGGDADPAAFNLPYETVTFPSAEYNQPTPAYFIPGTNGATVIVLPTGSAGRGDRLGEIAVYHAGGYNVLTFSSRVCVGGVNNSLGYLEARQVGDALLYLRTRADVDMRRIGAHGFSAGGAAAIMAAAQHPDLRAVVAQGGYHDFQDEITVNSAYLGVLAPLFRFGAETVYRMRIGHDISVLSPISAIGQIAPHPILLIYGTAEPGLRGARLQLAAAGATAQLWEVPGAGHGNYIDVAGRDAYAARVLAFMDGALGN